MDYSNVIHKLQSESIAQRLEGAELCAKNPEFAQMALIPLLNQITDSDDQLTAWTTAALEEVSEVPPEELDAVVAMISGTPTQAYWAATLLGRTGEPATLCVEALCQAIESEATSTEVRNKCLWAIQKIGRLDAAYKPMLQRAAKNENPRTARLAEKVLKLFDQ